jgi:TPR repeat protein
MKEKQLDHTLSKRQQNTLFEEGYRLAFLTRKKTKPWPKIYELWKASAINGHIRAQFYLATCYDNGYGVKKDLTEAFNWYMKAAKGGKWKRSLTSDFFIRRVI